MTPGPGFEPGTHCSPEHKLPRQYNQAHQNTSSLVDGTVGKQHTTYLNANSESPNGLSL